MTKNIFKSYGDDPFTIFQKWFDEAGKTEPSDPNAMCLATADAKGRPSARIVLLKSYDKNGFVFFTNYESRKGKDLIANPYAELNFHWKSTGKQIRIAGSVVKVSDAESDAYFTTRPRESQIGAHASLQTQNLDDYDLFRAAVGETEKRFAGQIIPRPAHWGGFCLKPERMEFWIGEDHRLHRRFVFEKNESEWKANWLFP